MEFFNYSGIIPSDIAYFLRYISFIDIDDYYKSNNIGYYSIRWSFYINDISNILYLKILIVMLL